MLKFSDKSSDMPRPDGMYNPCRVLLHLSQGLLPVDLSENTFLQIGTVLIRPVKESEPISTEIVHDVFIIQLCMWALSCCSHMVKIHCHNIQAPVECMVATDATIKHYWILKIIPENKTGQWEGNEVEGDKCYHCHIKPAKCSRCLKERKDK